MSINYYREISTNIRFSGTVDGYTVIKKIWYCCQPCPDARIALSSLPRSEATPTSSSAPPVVFKSRVARVDESMAEKGRKKGNSLFGIRPMNSNTAPHRRRSSLPLLLGENAYGVSCKCSISQSRSTRKVRDGLQPGYCSIALY